MKRILFLTGTRADYGKMKPLMLACEKQSNVDVFVYISGMHLLEKYGFTYKEVVKDNYSNLRMQNNVADLPRMDISYANLVSDFAEYVGEIHPDMIVVHGDRIDALAGAVVSMLNDVCLAHIEGGEVTGTVDEAIRHSISKMANLHFVANNESKIRLCQLGEDERNIFVIGSPDIDVMLSDNLPLLVDVKSALNIDFQEYAILIYHPVTTETDKLVGDIESVMSAVNKSGQNYIVIYPNNDAGTNVIMEEYARYKENPHFRFFPSINFESFLTLLKNAKFIIGNSSCGVREACVYGIPAVDIGSRQCARCTQAVVANVIHVDAAEDQVLRAIAESDDYNVASSYFGDGNSAKKFIELLQKQEIWETNTQKRFLDTPETKKAIQIYHNEVCF